MRTDYLKSIIKRKTPLHVTVLALRDLKKVGRITTRICYRKHNYWNRGGWKLCDAARVSIHLSQNDMNEILDAKN